MSSLIVRCQEFDCLYPAAYYIQHLKGGERGTYSTLACEGHKKEGLTWSPIKHANVADTTFNLRMNACIACEKDNAWFHSGQCSRGGHNV